MQPSVRYLQLFAHNVAVSFPIGKNSHFPSRQSPLRTGLCRKQTGLCDWKIEDSDIENGPPEIHRTKYRPEPVEAGKSAAETMRRQANPRECHTLSNPVGFLYRDQTAWLE
jgi:hypothetical protein